ncbi:putative Protein RTF1-like protein [Nannochloris sp. 'desiccata']|nr:hypothetical protein KSW81_000278 [Chlorella desiccata (nom. nud.)]KAH7620120.1 putative Protein RTF1-like protein [Chlorella desiccata (nom. nud.)]
MSGSELDDERLAGSGQVKGSSKRKRQLGSDSDDDVSLDEESDFEPEEYGAAAAKPRKKKPAGRKPLAAAANDGDNDDLVEDEEDAARLAKMSEFDREMLLAERAEQRQQKIQRDQILAAEAAAEQAKAKGAQRRSGREVREETAKKSAIEELKAARQRKAQGRKAHDAEDIDAAGADSDQDDGEQRREGAYYSEEDSEEDGEERGIGGTRWAARDRTEEDEEADEEADFEELKSIQVRRHKLEEWISKPHFETTLPGCMVRVVAGEKKTPDNVPVMLNARPEQRYMVVQVVGVEEVAPGFHKFLEGGQGWKSPYPFGPDGIKTSKWLRVLRGKSERLWPLAQVSNSGFSEDEFASWHRACESVAAGGGHKRQITRGEVAEVHQRLIDADRYVYTAEDVARMLEEKRLKGQGTRNVAIEMARLERQRDAAVERNDEERLLEVQQEITALEATAAVALAVKQGASASMAQLNKKNAEKNFKSAFKSGKDGAAGGGAAAGTLDPFSRRATRTKNYWNTKGQRGEEQGGGDGAAVLTEAELADLAVAEAAAAAVAAAKAEAAEITLVDLSGLDLSLLDLPPKVAPIARKLLGSHSSSAVAASRPGSGGGGATLSLADYKRRYNIA